MNLIEAIKSGKRFKRKAYSKFHKCDDTCSEGFTRTEVLADDWEIENEKIEITKDQLKNAIHKSLSNDTKDGHLVLLAAGGKLTFDDWVFERLFEELGFK